MFPLHKPFQEIENFFFALSLQNFSTNSGALRVFLSPLQDVFEEVYFHVCTFSKMRGVFSLQELFQELRNFGCFHCRNFSQELLMYFECTTFFRTLADFFFLFFQGIEAGTVGTVLGT